MQEGRDKEERVASPALSLLPGEEWGCQLVCLWGSLRRGSLATQRDGFTFLSNLVGTSLACSVRRLPPLEICATHQREHTQEEACDGPALGRAVAQALGQQRACPAGSSARSPRQSRGPGYILLFFLS